MARLFCGSRYWAVIGRDSISPARCASSSDSTSTNSFAQLLVVLHGSVDNTHSFHSKSECVFQPEPGPFDVLRPDTTVTAPQADFQRMHLNSISHWTLGRDSRLTPTPAAACRSSLTSAGCGSAIYIKQEKIQNKNPGERSRSGSGALPPEPGDPVALVPNRRQNVIHTLLICRCGRLCCCAGCWGGSFSSPPFHYGSLRAPQPTERRSGPDLTSTRHKEIKRNVVADVSMSSTHTHRQKKKNSINMQIAG